MPLSSNQSPYHADRARAWRAAAAALVVKTADVWVRFIGSASERAATANMRCGNEHANMRGEILGIDETERVHGVEQQCCSVLYSTCAKER
eukprot:IDg20823t1